MNFEKPPQDNNEEEKLLEMPNEQWAEKRLMQEVREAVFEDIIIRDILDIFKSELLDFDFSDEQISEFESELSKYENAESRSALSMPYELRQINFPRFIADVEGNRIKISGLVEKIVKIAKERGYTIGFHTSEKDLVPQDGKWDITGYEFDDRDERAMAYYSLDYRNIYRAKKKKFVYIIRAQTGEGTDHKLDGKNNWGRASTLSIVHKIDLEKLDYEVSAKMSEIEKGIREANAKR